MSIDIRYDTRTGKIIRPIWNDPQLTDGDMSVLRTYLVTDGEKIELNKVEKRWVTTPGKYRILLVYPPDWLTPHKIKTAVEEQYAYGEGIDPLANEGQRILPERIEPAAVRQYGSQITGVLEPWGKSNFVKNPGDMKLYYAIEAFNKKHGPSLAEQFLEKHLP
jgi:hypothetical protein